MPGWRMSWVNSVRLEREGERKPASPGVLERPVPSVRMVTRLREQVMPEKVEQGSGEVKSQVEKKFEPGMSVRLSFMAARAARSLRLILFWFWWEGWHALTRSSSRNRKRA